jgi:hypothetical protein
MAAIDKSGGLTPSERHLATLCEKSFLRLWSYPNLYRDEGRRAGKGDGKELCDLLVVFGDDVIIFSDKFCKFPDSSSALVDWRRWYKRSIQKSANQVFGAEAWIRQHPKQIYLDRGCTQLFPLALPPVSNGRLHRIVVARDSSTRCKAFFGRTASGSLMLNSGIIGAAHIDHPFTVGIIAPTRGFVHVLDDYTLDEIMREVDTITDFVAYLTKKEKLFTSKALVVAAGEEELLAHYLIHTDTTGEHDFVFPEEMGVVLFEEGGWASVKTDPRYIAKKQADRVSYLWDMQIETYHQHFLDGTLVEGSDLAISDHELGLRIMASEPRLSRRHLAYAIGDVMDRTPRGKSMARTVLSRERAKVGYVFLVVPHDDGADNESRKRRRAMLWAYCLVTRLKNPTLEYVIGIGTEPMSEPEHSYDLLCFDTTHWSPDLEAEAQRVHNLGILRKPTLTQHRTTEYPS